MEDIIFASIAIILIIIGIIGSVLPVLPASPLAWLGLLIFKFSNYCDYGWTTLIVTAVITLLMIVFEYIIPIIGTRKMGGSKYGSIGAVLGLLVGFFFPPFGFIIGAFAGAFVGEYIKNKDNPNGAFKAALGTFLGFLLSSGLSILICCAFLGIIIHSMIN